MAVLCLAYFVAIGAAVGMVALSVNRALAPTVSRRWLWVGTMVVSVLLPMLSSVHHRSQSLEFLGVEVVPLSGGQAGLLAGLNPGWIVCNTPLGSQILRWWAIATAILVALTLLDALRVALLVRRAASRPCEQGSIDGIPVVVTESLGPVTFGFWHSRVIVPRWVFGLPDAHKRYVVRHEEEHRRAHDTALLALGAALVCLMPWNLALWWQLRRLRVAVELDCDRRVVAALGDAPTYGRLLVNVAQASSRGPRLQPALAGRVGMLEERLMALVAPARRGVAARVLALTVALAVTALVLAVPHPVPTLPPSAESHRH